MPRFSKQALVSCLTLYAADIPWFAERQISSENIASVENPLASRQELEEPGRRRSAVGPSQRVVGVLDQQVADRKTAPLGLGGESLG